MVFLTINCEKPEDGLSRRTANGPTCASCPGIG